MSSSELVRGGRGSARLGFTLRSVLLAPHSGFAAALKTTERRSAQERRPAEGTAPYVLAFIGGAALASLWLKVGALAGFREYCPDQYAVGLKVAASLVLGGIFALMAQAIWGAVGSPTVRALRGEVGRGSLRLVWGAAAFPLVIALAVLLPLDLVIVGTDAFTSGSLSDPLSTAWAAFSIALGISAAAWSLFLFVRGIEVASGIKFWRAAAATAVAVGCFVAVAGVFAIAVTLGAEVRGCPTRLG